jgi:hypothetical protein
MFKNTERLDRLVKRCIGFECFDQLIAEVEREGAAIKIWKEEDIDKSLITVKEFEDHYLFLLPHKYFPQITKYGASTHSKNGYETKETLEKTYEKFIEFSNSPEIPDEKLQFVLAMLYKCNYEINYEVFLDKNYDHDKQVVFIDTECSLAKEPALLEAVYYHELGHIRKQMIPMKDNEEKFVEFTINNMKRMCGLLDVDSSSANLELEADLYAYSITGKETMLRLLNLMKDECPFVESEISLRIANIEKQS